MRPDRVEDPQSGSAGGPAAISGGPLRGVRVIEFGGLGPGPFAAMLLADLGAQVLRVDRPPRPDGSRGFAPTREARLDLLNRGRRSAVLDLARPGATDVALRLVERADVLVEGFRPGVMERLGLGPEPCLHRRPSLVYGRMTGWGQDGPRATEAGHDIAYLAPTGALHAIGRPGGPPTVPLNLLGDFGGGGMLLAVGVLAALLEARASGRGQVVDAAIVDGTSLLITMIYGMLADGRWVDTRGTNLLDGGAPWYDVYQTADGAWMAVGALEEPFYRELLDVLGLDELGLDEVGVRTDPRTWPRMRAAFAAAFASRSRAEWTERFAGRDACVAPVLSLTEAPRDPHLAARGTFIDAGGVIQPAPAPRFSRTPARLGLPPPHPGEHTLEVLSEWGVPD